MNSVRSNNISLKYQRFTTFGSKDIGIIESEFVAKTQLLYELQIMSEGREIEKGDHRKGI